MSDDERFNGPLDGGDTGPAAAETAGAETDEVARLRAELAEKQDKVLRTLAEMDNLRRRTQRERDEYVKFANESLIKDLIPVLDNFDRALQAAGTSTDAAKVVEGVELIRRELLRVLERAGVTRYSALGEAFDPTRHEATARVVSVDQPADTVVGEITPGYLLNGRVLRAAQVAVAAAPDEDAA
jgi:molecular chaperone GrpE